LKAGPVLNLREGEAIIVTYTSAADKLKIFSALIREGLENGDLVNYTYPDEEREIVRIKLKEHGIDVKKHEKNGSLLLETLTNCFMPNGKLDFKEAVGDGLKWWADVKKRGYKHIVDIQDVGDFSFVNGQWQKYITDYCLDSRWDDPNVSEWVVSKELVGVVMNPFIIDITAINVERMAESQTAELLKAIGKGKRVPVKFIDLLENIDLFSKSIGLDHGRLVGRKILLEFDPVSDYEKVVDRLAKETMANVEPIFVFTSNTSPVHSYLARQPTIKFFLTSISMSVPESISENKVLLPAKSVPLILDALSKVLETYVDTQVCVVFDILSELLTTVGRERTFTFLRHALNLLSSKKVTSLFLLNTGAHDAEVVSQLRNLFSNQLAYSKNGLKIMKTS